MARIRSKANEATELRFIRIARTAGLVGWRRGYPLPGKPDFVFARHKVVVFVDGCFWHGCPQCYRPPKSNQRYWRRKIIRNRQRDLSVNRLLRAQGWKVIRLWECKLRSETRVLSTLKKALQANDLAEAMAHYRGLPTTTSRSAARISLAKSRGPNRVKFF
jgi:DNA mismatch endonuclease (patch repair protein)